jgi:hypothetical protein
MIRSVRSTLLTASFGALVLAGTALCSAQATPTMYANSSKYHINDLDVGVAATGQYTNSITSQNYGSAGQTLPHQATTDSPGVLVTVRDQPFSWAGIEFNYQYTKFSERYFVRAANTPINAGANTPVFVPTSVHEATAAYLYHAKMKRVKPYAGIGGGTLYFTPATARPNQWRATGLAEVGLDIQTSSRLGFRFGGRGLFYRAPNFTDTALASSRWVSSTEPYAGVYIKF